ncbi:Signal peptidase subunit [Phaffia rhodozyma]|uniref:Signal peptidase complex subunit 1 n=1 Tax=Phaffia rhodozyma TaxID=264483 RepID=A0A0F7SHZ8_PHARH|nr:Signal peptidase subunit [Phaffia rhodozyma]
MDAFIKQVSDLCEGTIDHYGQHVVDRTAQLSLGIVATIAFLVGLVLQDIRMSLVIFGFSFFVLLLVVVPPWPMFNRHPVKYKSVAIQPKQ